MTIKEWQEKAHTVELSLGGWQRSIDPVLLIAVLAMIGTEVSEAIECIREGKFGESLSESGKPEGLPSELADIVLRTLDFAEAVGIDVENAMLAKHHYNATEREYKHGGKLL